MSLKYLAVLLTGVVMGATVQKWQGDASHARDAAHWADERLALANAAAAAQHAAMQEQQRRYEKINEVADEANEKIRRLVATERAAADKRVCDQAAAFARRGRSACATSPAKSGTAVANPAGVLAQLLGKLDEMAGVYAAESDRARVAGVACGRVYRSMRNHEVSGHNSQTLGLFR